MTQQHATEGLTLERPTGMYVFLLLFFTLTWLPPFSVISVVRLFVWLTYHYEALKPLKKHSFFILLTEATHLSYLKALT